MCLYPFGAPLSDVPDRAKDLLIQELAEMFCAEQVDGKSCIEHNRAYAKCCLVCKAKTLLNLPCVKKALDDKAD